MTVVGPEGRQAWLLGLFCMGQRGICISEKLQLWEGAGHWEPLAWSAVFCLTLGGVGVGEQALCLPAQPYLVRGHS